ncbi:hypothetical protein ACVW0P_004508 [Mucilaginibacter sp. UYNi724]
MKLKVIRKVFNKNNTIGDLYIDDVWFCYTLEDVLRDKKVKNATAIPYGVYKVILSLSNRFKRILPEVLAVPGFEGIRIHPGNNENSTSGCILVGYHTDNKLIWISKAATEDMVIKLTGQKDITLTIEKA